MPRSHKSKFKLNIFGLTYKNYQILLDEKANYQFVSTKSLASKNNANPSSLLQFVGDKPCYDSHDYIPVEVKKGKIYIESNYLIKTKM